MRRAKLIARLRELADYTRRKGWDMPLDLADILREAADALETPPWIPVEEYEPPTAATLLLSVRDPDDKRPYVTAGWKGAKWHNIFYPSLEMETITHWMLLPEPPEVEQSGGLFDVKSAEQPQKEQVTP